MEFSHGTKQSSRIFTGIENYPAYKKVKFTAPGAQSKTIRHIKK